MIGRLRGTIVGRSVEGLLLEVGGVGYEVLVHPRGLTDLPGLGEQAVLHTHLHVREDSHSVYGFVEEGERDLFRVLIGASGVGPKVAMAMLAALRPDEVRRAVLTEDVDALTLVPGIGPRSAQRLVLELKPKIAAEEAEMVGGSTLSQVRAALEGLGYGAAEIREVLAGLPAEDPVEEQLRAALQALGNR